MPFTMREEEDVHPATTERGDRLTAVRSEAVAVRALEMTEPRDSKRACGTCWGATEYGHATQGRVTRTGRVGRTGARQMRREALKEEAASMGRACPS